MTRQRLGSSSRILLTLGLSSLTHHVVAAGIALDLDSSGQYV